MSLQEIKDRLAKDLEIDSQFSSSVDLAKLIQAVEVLRECVIIYSRLKINNLIEPGHAGNIARHALTKSNEILGEK